MKAIKTILAAACLMSGIAVLANGDPVVEFSSINRVANPEPLSISEISITREIVNISHVGSRATASKFGMARHPALGSG